MYENSQFLKDRLPNYFANFSLENAQWLLYGSSPGAEILQRSLFV